jgi:zinc transport system substrate-binding protein
MKENQRMNTNKKRMKMNENRICSLLPLFAVLFLLLGGCSRGNRVAHNGQSATPLIAVSIVPQEWFVSRIGDGRVRTLVLAGPGQNPHNYEPTPKQISGLARAGAWVLSGTEFEISLRPKIEKLFPSLPLIDGTAGVTFRKLEDHDDDDEISTPHRPLSLLKQTCPSGNNDNDRGSRRADSNQETQLDAVPSTVVPLPHNIDRHTWLGSQPAKILAGHIRDALSLVDPAGSAYYDENYSALILEIDAEFSILRRELAPLKGSNVFVYHPSFGYFLDEFGISQEAVETGGKEPGPRDLARLIARAKQEQPAAIFVQAQFPVSAAQTVADAVGAVTITLDPLAPDWLANIRYMGEALRDSAR